MNVKNSFREKVFEVTRSIPKGQTMTYGEVARLAGRPLAARAVGNILHTNYDPAIPCHRVVHADGTLGGYNRGEAQKKAILVAEGAYDAANERISRTGTQSRRGYTNQSGGGRAAHD